MLAEAWPLAQSAAAVIARAPWRCTGARCASIAAGGPSSQAAETRQPANDVASRPARGLNRSAALPRARAASVASSSALHRQAQQGQNQRRGGRLTQTAGHGGSPRSNTGLGHAVRISGMPASSTTEDVLDLLCCLSIFCGTADVTAKVECPQGLPFVGQWIVKLASADEVETAVRAANRLRIVRFLAGLVFPSCCLSFSLSLSLSLSLSCCATQL